MSAAGIERRTFLAAAGSCAAHLLLSIGAGGAAARRLFAMAPAGTVLAEEPWGRVERLAESAWALVSTPLAGGPDAMRTFSNGGIVAGREGVAIVEGFASEEGARWMAETAKRLTGRWPTHVVLTHYHGDHSNGLAGYEAAGARPIILSTEKTREDLEARSREQGEPSPAIRVLSGDGVEILPEDASTTLDLGGRRLEITHRSGHTRSDLDVVLAEPRIVWCGDLVWNGLFPNYMDATPSELSRHVRTLLGAPAERWVPGHGSLADRAALERYVALLDDVEAAARRAIEAGTPVDAAAREYRPPVELGEWVLFSDRYHEVAFEAWDRELSGREG